MFDPVSLEILWGRLLAIVDESASALQRTSFSTTVRESNDFACVLFGPDGTTLAENTLGVPSFAGVMSLVIKNFLAVYPVDTWKPGDVAMTNDPWINTGHLPDTAIITPIFYKDHLVAFAGNTAHKQDIGGQSGAEATDVFEEGMRIPICKLYDAGKPNNMLIELIRTNVRVPDSVLGDLHAQVAAAHVCETRVCEFLHEQEISDLSEIGRAIQDRAETAMRQAISVIPDGEFTSVIKSDGYDSPTEVRVRVMIKGDGITVDFTGTSPQVRRGINGVYNYVYAFACYTLKCLLDPVTRKNEGSYKAFNIIVPEGTILNAKFPAPVNGRSMTGHFVTSAILVALAQALPNRIIADSGSCPGLRVRLRGSDARGGRFVQTLYTNGGMGARSDSDGLSTTGFPTNAGGGSVEILESVAPLLLWKRELLCDSGGPGEFRGGLGQQIELESLSDQPMDVICLFDRVNHPAQGIFGGGSGGRSQLLLNDTKELPGKGRALLRKGDRLSLKYAGGGGYGFPRDRARELVREDLENGYISKEAARSVYGIEINED